MTKILFITSTRIGDAVLSTGLIDHLLKTVENPRFTIVCGPLPASLFEGVPNLDRLIILKKQKHSRHWLELWKQVIGTKWDIVIDLRNSAVSRLIFANKKYIFGAHIKAIHKAEQNAEVMKLTSVPLPRLFVAEAQAEKARAYVPEGSPVLGIGPTANWIGKTWPAENFIDIIKSLTAVDGILSQARVAIFAAPGEEEAARQVYATIPEGRGIDIIAKVNPGEAAAMLARCALYIGNDSGLMHCAAAAGIPTVGLFGASYVDVYGPYGPKTTYAHTPESFDELTDGKGYQRSAPKVTLMRSLTVEAVLKTVQDFWRKLNN